MDKIEELKREIAQLESTISRNNTKQMAIKILINSEYGATGSKYFRYYELRNAEAVTSLGQLVIQWSKKHINKYLNHILSTNNVEYVIYSDTDSNLIELNQLVETFIPTGASTNQIVDILDKWASSVMTPQIEKIYENLGNYLNVYEQKMVMKREVIAESGFWTGKKRYALSIWDNEGVRYSEPHTKIMGLESVRSSVPQFCRNHIETAIIKILRETEEDVQKYIDKVREEFYNQEAEVIASPSGVNNIGKWTDTDGSAKKGTPIHVRGCIVYNKYLDDTTSVEEKIQSGDKIKYCLLKTPNAFRSHVIAFPPLITEEFKEILKENIDFNTQYEKTFLKPVRYMLECCDMTPERINKMDRLLTGEEY